MDGRLGAVARIDALDTLLTGSVIETGRGPGIATKVIVELPFKLLKVFVVSPKHRHHVFIEGALVRVGCVDRLVM